MQGPGACLLALESAYIRVCANGNLYIGTLADSCIMACLQLVRAPLGAINSENYYHFPLVQRQDQWGT